MEIEEIIMRCKQGEKEAFRELLQTVEKKALATVHYTLEKIFQKLMKLKNLYQNILKYCKK